MYSVAALAEGFPSGAGEEDGGARCGQSEHEAQLRQQIFLFAIGTFLVVYLISLFRFRSFEWAMLTSSVTFVVTAGAGALLAAVVKLRDDGPELEAHGTAVPDGSTAAATHAGGPRGNVTDFRSSDRDVDFDADDRAAN